MNESGYCGCGNSVHGTATYCDECKYGVDSSQHSDFDEDFEYVDFEYVD